MACGTRALHSTIGTADTDASRMQFEKQLRPLQRQTGGKTYKRCAEDTAASCVRVLLPRVSHGHLDPFERFLPRRGTQNQKYNQPHFQQQAQVKMRTRSRPYTAEEEEARMSQICSVVRSTVRECFSFARFQLFQYLFRRCAKIVRDLFVSSLCATCPKSGRGQRFTRCGAEPCPQK